MDSTTAENSLLKSHAVLERWEDYWQSMGNDGLLTFWCFVRGRCTVGALMPKFTSAAELTGAFVPAEANESMNFIQI